MIVWLKIIFIGILSLFVFQNMPEEATSDHKTNIYANNKESESNVTKLSFIESSSESNIQRTINHILKSRYADLSIPSCIFTTGSKDNNDSKSLLPTACGGMKKYAGLPDYRLSKLLLSTSHNFINSPKLYYIYTLERIII